MLLALDTSTPRVAVALWDGSVLDSSVADAAMRHGEQLAPMISAALSRVGAGRRDLTGVAVGVGPGPYTGLRVGLVTARTLGLALGLEVRGVVSLDVLAAQAHDSGLGPLVATLDARRKELFWAAYDEQGRRVEGPNVSTPDRVPTDAVVVGAGPVLYPDLLPAGAADLTTPDAGWLARCVAGGVPEGVAEVVSPEPVYLRRPDAMAPGPAKRVS